MKAGVGRAFTSDVLIAKLAHRRVVDRPVVRIVGPEALLSIGNVYEQSHVARLIYGPVFGWREVSWLRSELPCSSPKVRIVVWSTV